MPKIEADISNLVYTQTPECFYPITHTTTWSGLTTYVTEQSDFILDVVSNNVAHAGST